MKALKGIIIVFIVSLLSGCLYPEENNVSSNIPYERHVEQIQEAVDAYQKDHNGMLPMKNSEPDTPLFQKYHVDFSKLIPKYIAEPPTNAYESGGVYQYLIIDEQTEPKVRLLDLRITEALRDVNLRLQMYVDKHTYPPYKEVKENGLYTLDYKKLHMKEAPKVISPFSGRELEIIINNEKQLFVNYEPDIQDAIRNAKSEKLSRDPRFLLTDQSLFVPAYSLAYITNDNGELQLVNKP